VTRRTELALVSGEGVIMRPLSRGAQRQRGCVELAFDDGRTLRLIAVEKEQGRERGLGGEHGPANFDAEIR